MAGRRWSRADSSGVSQSQSESLSGALGPLSRPQDPVHRHHHAPGASVSAGASLSQNPLTLLTSLPPGSAHPAPGAAILCTDTGYKNLRMELLACYGLAGLLGLAVGAGVLKTGKNRGTKQLELRMESLTPTRRADKTGELWFVPRQAQTAKNGKIKRQDRQG